jgi:hypothetical protein
LQIKKVVLPLYHCNGAGTKKKTMKVHLAKENGKETLCGGRISSAKSSGGGSNGSKRNQYFDVDVNYFTTCSTKERCVKCDAAFQLQTAK